MFIYGQNGIKTIKRYFDVFYLKYIFFSKPKIIFNFYFCIFFEQKLYVNKIVVGYEETEKSIFTKKTRQQILFCSRFLSLQLTCMRDCFLHVQKRFETAEHALSQDRKKPIIGWRCISSTIIVFTSNFIYSCFPQNLYCYPSVCPFL